MEEATPDEPIDLLDRRGRLVRLAISGVIGVAVSIALLWAIRGAARDPNEDAISQISPVLLGMGIFAVTASLANAVLVRLRRA